MEGDEEKEGGQERGQFSESYSKMTAFLRGKPTRKKLEQFMKENPGLIIYVSKDQVQKAYRQREEKRPRPTRIIRRRKTPVKRGANFQEQN